MQLKNELAATQRQCDTLRESILDAFMAGFNWDALNRKAVYQMIKLRDGTENELVDSLDPFNEGILFSVRPPKKSWRENI